MENYIVVRGTDVRGGARSALVLRYLEKGGGDGGALSRSHSRAGVRDADPREGQGRCLGGGAHREGVRRVRGVGELELGRVACQACAGPREREREKTLMGVGGGWMACGGAAVALLSCQKVVWPVAASVACPPHPCGWPVVVVPQVACCGDGLPARPPACLASPP